MSTSIHTTQPKQANDGIHIRQILLHEEKSTSSEKHNKLTCYVEILQDLLKGIGCQNDLGFIVFSGGIQKKHFIFEKTNPFFSRNKARLVTDLLMINLFRQYNVNNSYQIKKTKIQTTISRKGKKLAEIRQ